MHGLNQVPGKHLGQELSPNPVFCSTIYKTEACVHGLFAGWHLQGQVLPGITGGAPSHNWQLAHMSRQASSQQMPAAAGHGRSAQLYT